MSILSRILGVAGDVVVPTFWGEAGATQGKQGWLVDAALERAYVDFSVPDDFASLISAELIILALATEAPMKIDVIGEYGAIGETSTAHSENAVVEVATTNFLYAKVSVAGVLSALAAGDNVYLTAKHDTNTNAYIAGVRLKYKRG